MVIINKLFGTASELLIIGSINPLLLEEFPTSNNNIKTYIKYKISNDYGDYIYFKSNNVIIDSDINEIIDSPVFCHNLKLPDYSEFPGYLLNMFLNGFYNLEYNVYYNDDLIHNGTIHQNLFDKSKLLLSINNEEKTIFDSMLSTSFGDEVKLYTKKLKDNSNYINTTPNVWGDYLLNDKSNVDLDIKTHDLNKIILVSPFLDIRYFNGNYQHDLINYQKNINKNAITTWKNYESFTTFSLDVLNSPEMGYYYTHTDNIINQEIIPNGLNRIIIYRVINGKEVFKIYNLFNGNLNYPSLILLKGE